MDWVYTIVIVDLLVGAPLSMAIVVGAREAVRALRRRRSRREIPKFVDELCAELISHNIIVTAHWDSPTVTLCWLPPDNGSRFILRNQRDHDPWANAARRLVGRASHFERPPPSMHRLTDDHARLGRTFGTRFATPSAASALEGNPDTGLATTAFVDKWTKRLGLVSFTEAGAAITVRAGDLKDGKRFLHAADLREIVRDLVTAARALPQGIGPQRPLPAELSLRRCPQCHGHHQNAERGICPFCGRRPRQHTAPREPVADQEAV